MRGPFSPITEQVADGVWRHYGDLKRAQNVFFIEDEGGVTQFDAGTSAMTEGVAEAAAELGGLKRVVLGHSHADHRGSAPGLGVPVLCHGDERADAESDGGIHYFKWSTIEIAPVRWVYPTLMKLWDGGPVKVAETLEEGDEVAGFKVIHFPGHAPGLIGLWRERDRLALVSDVVYVVDSIRIYTAGLARIGTKEEPIPTVPHPFSTQDRSGAAESVRKLAALEPATVWPGHAEALTGHPAEVRAQLERAADAVGTDSGQ